MTEIYIGTTSGMRVCEAPDLPFPMRRSGWGDSLALENGGFMQATSAGGSAQFDFSFGIRASSDFDWYRQLKQGGAGSGLVHFANPEVYETNLCPPAWAAPGLIEQGWASIYDADPASYANVSANSYLQPLRKAVFSITQAANTAPTYTRSRLIIPIPPTMTLRLGVSAAVTGTGQVYATAYNIAAGTTSAGALTLLTDTSSTRLNTSYSGASWNYVAIDLRRSTSATSTVTITSMLAQLWTTGITPTLTGNHVPGEGQTGMRFTPAWSESVAVSGYRSLAFSLVEVGAWLR